tara:strand:- start:880 stop:1389 length:510 start_codon:yes stop_codon:yes gene_type:complete
VNYTDWINNNYELILQTAKNITKNHQDTGDLVSEVILQMFKKPPVVKKGQELYYIIKVLKLNWFSKTSRYHYNFRRKIYNNIETSEGYEYIENLEQEDKPYNESEYPTTEWVKETVNKLSWFKRDIFLMYMELGTLTNVAKKTTIPINSCGRYIKDIKVELLEIWNQRY